MIKSWKSLDSYIARRLSFARKKLQIAREGYSMEERGPQGWEGYIAALQNLRRKLKKTNQ